MSGAEPSLRVLVVDDEEALGIGVRRVLEPFRVPTSDAHAEAALEVRIAKSGEEGLAVLKDFPADLVLLDYKLPGMNGVEALKEIRKFAPGPRVIMMTGYTVEDLIRDSISSGAEGALKKPIDYDTLLQLIEGKMAGRM